MYQEIKLKLKEAAETVIDMQKHHVGRAVILSVFMQFIGFLSFRFIWCFLSDLMFADQLLLYNRYHCYFKWLLTYKFLFYIRQIVMYQYSWHLKTAIFSWNKTRFYN
jgi:hypothetical protein